jgi:NACHT domain
VTAPTPGPRAQCRRYTGDLQRLLVVMALCAAGLSACLATCTRNAIIVRMSRLAGRRVGAALLLIAVAIGVLWLGRYLAHRGLEWAAKFSEVASFVLAVAGVLAASFGKFAQWLRGTQPPTLERIASAGSRLRAALNAAWDAEGSEVYEDQPMQVRFSPWADVVGRRVLPDGASPDMPTAGQPSAGDFRSVVEAFSREPRFRRVVLGEAGAGKSVLVAELQRKLLAAPESDGPVPVIVPAGDWRPDRRSLLDWLADRLAADYAWLPATHARALVASSKVVPILDGLDEMPRALQPAAVARINEHRVYRPLIVTSREEQYLDAIRQNREGIKDAPVVAIRPLLAGDIQAYLDPTGRGPWAEVLARMDADGPLAAVLANPLMLWLARVVYADKSPGNLAFLNTRTSLENHLLEELVPAVYDGERGWPRLRGFRCAGWQAERWLGALAHRHRSRRLADQDRQADDHSSAALEWWRFGAAAGWWRALGIGLRAVLLSGVAAALFVWVLARQGNWRHGAYSGPVNFGDLLLGGRAGQLIQPTVQHLAQAFPKDTGRHVQAGITSVFHVIFSHLALFIVAVIAYEFLLAAVILLTGSEVPCRLQIRAMRAFTRALASCSLIFVIAVVGLLLLLHLPRRPVSAGAFFDARSTWVTLLAVSLVGLISIPSSFLRRSDISGNLSPWDSLRLDRQADAVVTISKRSAIAMAVWLFCGSLVAAAYGIFAITATLVALTLGGQQGRASRSYIDARLWLALRGRLPWRTMTFLADASRRGVLRQAGAIYQFRHARLQEQADSWRRARGPRLENRWNTWKGRLHEVSNLIGQYSGVNPPPWVALNELCEKAAQFRRIARTSPELPPRFREDLDDLAYRLLTGPAEGALAARILLDTYQTLAEANPAAFTPDRAKAMNSLARIFPRHEALQLQKNAVGEYGELAADDPATFLPGLAQAVRDLANQLTQLGRADEAFQAVSDLADACRRSAETDPAIFLPVLAESLSDLADRVWRSEPEESLALRREAAALYRTLAGENPARFGSRLTSSLDSLACSLRELVKREEELEVAQAAIGAHRARAEYIAAIRHQIERRTAASKAFRAWDLAESQPAEFLPALAYAARDLAVGLNTIGRRREALALVDEVNAIESLHQYRQRHEQVAVMHGEAWEAPSVDRMAALALRLWKLGEQQEALATARACRELAPAGRIGAKAPDPARAWLTRFISRLWEASGMDRQREETCFWRRMTRQDSAYRLPPIAKSTKELGLLEAARQLCAKGLEWLSDSRDTLAFQRQVAGRNADALTATRRAVNVQRRAVSIYRRMCRRVYAESDLARSLDTLALRLRAAGQAEAAADAAYEASKIRDLLPTPSGSLP